MTLNTYTQDQLIEKIKELEAKLSSEYDRGFENGRGYDADKKYRTGFLDGIEAYAWHKDGGTFVGTTGRTLKKAQLNVEDTWNYCPDCVHQESEPEPIDPYVPLSKQDLVTMAINGEFENIVMRYTWMRDGAGGKVVEIFDDGHTPGLFVVEIWHGERLGNECYLSSYPDDSQFVLADPEATN